ncbi:MAG: PTS lactose/cellobiose transporter subunit IIA [Fusobacteriaceae bacterium]
MEELFDEEFLEKIMMGVAVAGTAKSLGKEAIMSANSGNFEKARELFKEAKKEFLKVHGSHFELIQQEAQGKSIPISLLLVHMEDHVMTTSAFLDTVDDQISLIERVCKLEKLLQKN